MIKTKEIQLTPKEFFHIWLKKSWANFILIFVLLFFFALGLYIWIFGKETLLQNKTWTLAGILIYDISVILFTILRAWMTYRSPKNKIFYLPFHAEIDEKFIKTIKVDGSYTSFNWSDISKTQKIDHYYVIAVSRVSALFLPIEAFESQDIEKFEGMLREKKLMK